MGPVAPRLEAFALLDLHADDGLEFEMAFSELRLSFGERFRLEGEVNLFLPGRDVARLGAVYRWPVLSGFVQARAFPVRSGDVHLSLEVVQAWRGWASVAWVDVDVGGKLVAEANVQRSLAGSLDLRVEFRTNGYAVERSVAVGLGLRL